jgi:hypothetical protein
VVLIFSRPGMSDMESEISRLRSSVDEMKKEVDAQAGEIRGLRSQIERLHRKEAGAAAKDNK